MRTSRQLLGGPDLRAIIASGLIMNSLALAQPQYEIVDIHATDTYSNVVAINDAGVMVGDYGTWGWGTGAIAWYSAEPGDYASFCFAGCSDHYEKSTGINNVNFAVGENLGAASLVDLSTMEATSFSHSDTHPTDVNDNLVVVGKYYDWDDPDVNWVGFKWTPDGGFEPLLPLGEFAPFPLAINNAGEVVGRYRLSTGEDIAFIHDDQHGLQDLNDRLPPDSLWHLEYANDINEAGEIVGYGTFDGAPDRAFLLQGDVVTDLGGFFPEVSEAVAINDHGDVLLQYDEGRRSVLYTAAGDFYDIDNLISTPGNWHVRRVRDINNSGQIVGGIQVEDPEPQNHAVLLTPVDCPEDLTGDGHIGQDDLGVLLASYGVDAGGDIDGDGDTDQADLGALLGRYGEDCRGEPPGWRLAANDCRGKRPWGAM